MNLFTKKEVKIGLEEKMFYLLKINLSKETLLEAPKASKELKDAA